MKTLFLFRHGETDWNVQERFQGHMDVPLNENGRKQAEGIIPHLRKNQIEVILSSDLIRALETAQIVAKGLGIEIFQDPGLREAYLGEAQGLTRSEIEQKFGVHLSQRWHSPHLSDADVSYPGGETGMQIAERAFDTLKRFLESHPFTTIGVATHGGIIRRVMQRLRLGAPPVPIPNGVIYKIEYHPKQGFSCCF